MINGLAGAVGKAFHCGYNSALCVLLHVNFENIGGSTSR